MSSYFYNLFLQQMTWSEYSKKKIVCSFGDPTLIYFTTATLNLTLHLRKKNLKKITIISRLIASICGYEVIDILIHALQKYPCLLLFFQISSDAKPGIALCPFCHWVALK